MLRERPRQTTSDVAAVIREVRTRWRRKLLVRGGLELLVGGAVLLVAAGFALEALRFTPDRNPRVPHRHHRRLFALAAWTLGRPLLRQVSDEQVALYLEEHEPSLNSLLLSAMSAERTGTRRTSRRRWCASDTPAPTTARGAGGRSSSRARRPRAVPAARPTR